MTWIIKILRTRLGQAAAVALAALAALGLARREWRAQGREEAEREAQDDARKRVEEGNEAVSDNRGDDPADRLHRNKDRW